MNIVFPATVTCACQPHFFPSSQLPHTLRLLLITLLLPSPTCYTARLASAFRWFRYRCRRRFGVFSRPASWPSSNRTTSVQRRGFDRVTLIARALDLGVYGLIFLHFLDLRHDILARRRWWRLVPVHVSYAEVKGGPRRSARRCGRSWRGADAHPVSRAGQGWPVHTTACHSEFLS